MINTQTELITLLQEGLSLHKKGLTDKAKLVYEKVLKLDPSNFDCLYLLSSIAIESGDLNEAEILLSKTLSIKPTEKNAQFNLAVIKEKLNKYEEALFHYQSAIDSDEKFYEAIVNQANLFVKTGNLKSALVRYSQAKLIQTNNNQINLEWMRVASEVNRIYSNYEFKILHQRGLLELNEKKFRIALEYFDKAIEINPASAEAHHNKGMALEKLGEFSSALLSYEHALIYKEDSAETHNNHGNMLRELGNLDGAIKSLDKSIELKPSYAEALNNRGWVWYEKNEFTRAKRDFENALSANVALYQAEFNLSLVNLMLGEYELGWQRYESRMKLPYIGSKVFAKPLWLGKESLENKSIYVFSEQGFGDTFQFCRYIPLLKELNVNIYFEPHHELLNVLNNFGSYATLIGPDRKLPDYDFYIPLMSLPLAFNTTIESIPKNIPYIFSDQEKSNRWRKRLSEIQGPKVGLVWSGGFRKERPELWGVNQRRNISFRTLLKINLSNINFFSLQKGAEATEEFRQEKTHWDGQNFFDFTEDLLDFSDTAALIQNLDLVISVDTSTAHLAAAMGKPVWLLSRFNNCWRWLTNVDSSPWYPHIRLYRQTMTGNWDEVIHLVKKDLIEHFK